MLAGIALVVGPIGYAASGTAGLGTGLVVGLVAGLGTGLAFGLGAGLAFGLGTGLAFVLGAGLGAGLAFVLGERIGVLLRSGLREGFTDFPNLWPYLRLMGRPLLGYMLGYVALIVWFASVYASLYGWIGRIAFSISFTPHFGDFLFFAITIFPPIGAYSDLKPLAPWAQGVVAGELIVGVGYTTVVFAAILAYRTPAFGKLAKNKEPSTEEMIANLKTDLCRAQEQTHTDLTGLDKRMARIESRLEELTK